ncbi:MAG: C39 family peptidase [Solirubrobacteraceae bacterium]
MTAIFTRRADRLRLRRRRVAALALLVGLGGGTVALTGGAPESHAAPPVIRLEAGNVPLARVPLAPLRTSHGIDAATLRSAVISALPATATMTHDRARITYTYNRGLTAERAVLLARLAPGGGTLAVVRTPISSQIAAPVIAQTLRNDCEATALSILLRSAGVTVSQARLQASLPRSGPLDPTGGGPSKVWGDPDQGFVGRPNGAGTAGGFGVYPAPLAGLARRYGVALANLTGVAPQAIYDALLAGRAVIAWVGLADGPYDTWQTPAGKAVTVNLNEHTVVLRGINADGTISVSNPLKGTAETWSRNKFETMWQLLGRRALSTDPTPDGH